MPTSLPSLLFCGLALMAFMGLSSAVAQSPFTVEARADRLVQSSLRVDGHADLPYRLNTFYEDPADSTVGGDFDYPRAQAGGLNAPFMSIYVPTHLQDTPGAATDRADALIDLVERIAEPPRQVHARPLPGRRPPHRRHRRLRHDHVRLCLSAR